MSKESSYTSIVLKKQAYGEGDEIITFYTREAGKLRALAKSSKFSKSKLQYALQSLFFVKITLAGNGLAKIIGVELINSFSKVRESYQTSAVGLFAEELLVKFTADEQPNPELFDLSLDFLTFLNTVASERTVALGLSKYKIDFLGSLGIGIREESGNSLYFSSSKGGFTSESSADAIPVRPGVFQLLMALKQSGFSNLPGGSQEDEKELQELLSSFLRYQLERDIKSEGLLIDML